MLKRSPATSVRHIALAVAIAAGLAVGPSARAADPTLERADLAMIVRELNLVDRLALEGRSVAPHDGRYHFDYTRLESDLARVRAGINDYLTPPRAQPRDQIFLSGDYRRESKEP
ncbi:MAG: RAQPRD family integrative conjugative element protein [Steroidobacteraceae bacterium]